MNIVRSKLSCELNCTLLRRSKSHYLLKKSAFCTIKYSVAVAQEEKAGIVFTQLIRLQCNDVLK